MIVAVVLLGLATAPPAQVVSSPPENPASAASIDPARLAAARRLLDRMQVEQTLDQMFTQLAPMFATSVIGGMMGSPDGKAVAEQLMASATGGGERFQAILAEEFLASIRKQYAAIKGQAARDYATQLTTGELVAIDDFYATGPGAKFLKVSPVLQQSLANAGQSLGAVAGTEAGRRGVERAMAEMLPNTMKKAM